MARATNVASVVLKTYSEIAGRLERSGRMCAIAGRIWSVETLSPSLISTSPRIESGSTPRVTIGLMFGPRRISTRSGCGEGGSIMRSSSTKARGARTRTGAEMLRGSTTSPATAAAAHTAGLAR